MSSDWLTDKSTSTFFFSIPHAYSVVPGTGDDLLAVRRERDGINPAGVTLEWITDRLARLNIPGSSCLVIGTTYDVAAVGGERDGPNPVKVAF